MYPVFRHPSCLQLPCTHPWYTARPATGHAGGPQATSPLLSSRGRPSAAAALGPPAPTSDGPLRGPGLRCASPQLFTRRTAGAPDAPRGRRRGLHIPALRPVGSAGRMLHQATSSTPDRPLHSPRGRSAAASLPRSSDDPPRLPGHPAAEGSGALIVGRMMPVSKPFLLHARGHRAQLRTPHPVLVSFHIPFDKVVLNDNLFYNVLPYIVVNKLHYNIYISLVYHHLNLWSIFSLYNII